MQDKQGQSWSSLDKEWDVIIIGGGITGAGLFRMASACGLKTLLIDSGDFSIGTSSRSSKLVHGGLRYLRNLQFKVTFESVRERERLLHEAPDLVTPLRFILPIYENYQATQSQIGFSLGLYDIFGKKRAHGELNEAELNQKAHLLNKNKLTFSYFYYDAEVDDSRLVIRNIQEGIEFGGTALNYVKGSDLLLNRERMVVGVVLNNRINGNQCKELFATAVVNATGPWSDELRGKVSNKKIVRKLRGSHIQFSQERFPVNYGFSLFHPGDRRSFFILPWEGVTVVGTTDLDHPSEYERDYAEPFMTYQEEEYLLSAANYFFPSMKLTPKDIISSFSGLRPIVSSDTSKPSKASRAHVLLQENGLLTITGGKLTTYRQMAYEVMRKIQLRLYLPKRLDKKARIFHENIEIDQNDYSNDLIHRWQGRFGKKLPDFIASIQKNENAVIPATQTSWAEIRWAARNEHIVHLDDLLLRRVRLGLLLPKGGMQHEDRIRKIVMEECGWDEEKWKTESERYKQIINRYYSKSS